MAKFGDLIKRVMGWRLVRVIMHYLESRGILLAGGLSYQAIFAVFAAIWVSFSVAGLFITANPDIQQAFFRLLSTSAPGLIDSGDGEGIIKPETLLRSKVLGWTGAIALVGLLATALGWLASARDAVREIFGLPAAKLNFALQKLKDIGLGIGFGATLLLSAALLVFSTQALDTVREFVGLAEDSLLSSIAARVVGLALMFALDTAVLATLFRGLSGLKIPLRRLAVGSLIGAAGLGALKVLGTALLGGATRNPLLASFAVIIGLLIWFNLICQVMLISASWIAVGMSDHRLIADPRVERERQEARKREAERQAVEREAEAAKAQQEARRRRWGWLHRLVGRKRYEPQ